MLFSNAFINLSNQNAVYNLVKFYLLITENVPRIFFLGPHSWLGSVLYAYGTCELALSLNSLQCIEITYFLDSLTHQAISSLRKAVWPC